MADNTSIEWTDSTLNPVTGCTRASAGCDLCYSANMTARLEMMGMEKYAGLVNPGKPHFNGVVTIHPDVLQQPFKRRKRTLYFVGSMSDIFHKLVPFEFIAAIFGMMAAAPRHTYQILSKRSERVEGFFAWLEEQAALLSERTGKEMVPVEVCLHYARQYGVPVPETVNAPWPLPNVWLGVSVEDQSVVHRIDHLREVPAAVRFISAEPLIGPLHLNGRLEGIHWVIVGGESGRGARRMDLDWVRSIRAACMENGVAYFFKQTGSALAKKLKLRKKGGDPPFWTDEIRAIGERQMPRST